MWQELKALHDRTQGRRIVGQFKEDPERAARFSAQTDALRLDYSKTLIDASIRAALIALCDRVDLAGRRAAMFGGALVNETEHRAALHTALRNLDGGPVLVEGQDVMPQVRSGLARMQDFSRALRDGTLSGSGGAITDVISIGIGGSDLGPAMATLALAPYHDGPRLHYVSNVDGAHLADTLKGLDPKTTWVNVSSKTFTTVETMTNAHSARDWMQRGGGDPARQFSAISCAGALAGAFGIPPERVFGFADWVGGRYSIWGPIGLPLMIAVGPDTFVEFLRGGQAMDAHFRTAAWGENLPVLMALTGLWHSRVCGFPTRAVLPYDQRLARLPAYLQQLEMESNGKSVAMDGSALEGRSGPIVWGEPGTNGQHAFFQLLHQGTDVVPCEFLIAARGHEPEMAHHHRLLMANCLAQSKALMLGRSLDQARAMMEAQGMQGAELERQARHRVFEGNRPSVTLSYPQLTPFVLGQLIALYEHRVFVEGVILGINSFDQFGVELGKEVATWLTPILAGDETGEGLDGSTLALVDHLRQHGG
ncbi:glucose-6-phosphate isomerase [Antarcticimicrobium sediminis]|uniref:Glucose-6-phosphate isomerase n=1 Tax=Antarcticimicrobium sediminis TaxID=2546227 RepID=A0A4R5EUH8_9RHOB|nr:glucose-6-phosphate isomerase [Antarcticimicrobium sediminis]TDE38460.1 glucose-6-phosphate isomerase [Antarcticimicrobium sediminis]